MRGGGGWISHQQLKLDVRAELREAINHRADGPD
jgi:hypothetical protein